MERKQNQIRPGTVSNILWHFTGGPRWNGKGEKQENNPKPPSEAYSNLCSILDKDPVSGKRILKTGKYKEIIRSETELWQVSGKLNNIINGKKEIESSPVCCLAEIPIMHLNYVCKRYGKFAIGFYKKAVIKNHFNPVFYTFELSSIAGAINTLSKKIELLKIVTKNFNDFISGEKDSDFTTQISDLKEIYNFQVGALEQAEPSWKRILSFVKTITESELESIYCEREWRSTYDFRFTCDDVAMIILPKKGNYFNKFIEEEIDRLSIPRKIPIVAWEDLIEH